MSTHLAPRRPAGPSIRLLCLLLAGLCLDWGTGRAALAQGEPVAPGTRTGAVNRTIGGALTGTDPRLPSGQYHDAYTLSLETPGQRVLLVLHASDFDPYLMLQSPSGEVTHNDDYEGSLSFSLIEHTVAEPGTWTVYVTTSSEGATGSYGLFIQQAQGRQAEPLARRTPEPRVPEPEPFEAEEEEFLAPEEEEPAAAEPDAFEPEGADVALPLEAPAPFDNEPETRDDAAVPEPTDQAEDAAIAAESAGDEPGAESVIEPVDRPEPEPEPAVDASPALVCPAVTRLIDAAGDAFRTLRGTQQDARYENAWTASLRFPGARECLISELSGTTYACTLLETPRYADAREGYEALVRTLRGCLPDGWHAEETEEGQMKTFQISEHPPPASAFRGTRYRVRLYELTSQEGFNLSVWFETESGGLRW